MQIKGPTSQPPRRSEEPEEPSEPRESSRESSRSKEGFKIPDRDAKRKPKEFDELIKETKKHFDETNKQKKIEKDLEKYIDKDAKKTERDLDELLNETEDFDKNGGKKPKDLDDDDKKLQTAILGLEEAIKMMAKKFTGEEVKGKGGAEKISASAEVQKTIASMGDLIQQKVDAMAVNEKSVLMTLKQTQEVPTFLQGAQINVNKIDPGTIAISISNLTVPNVAKAVTFINERSTELQTLMQNLQAKNIVLAELRVGDQLITLPAVQVTAPGPVSTPQGPPSEGFRERGQQGQGGGEGDRGGEGKEERKRR